MPHAQTWALSQTANKSSGECSECHEIRQLHIKDGTVHRHGPRSKPCAGSGKPPCQGNDLTSNSTSHSNIDTSTASLATSTQLQSNEQTSANVDQPHSDVSRFSHPSDITSIIKHIPKSARPSCAKMVTSILKDISLNVDDLRPWSALFSFANDILSRPTRGGKRHNLASIIKRRTAAITDPTEPTAGPCTSHCVRLKNKDPMKK